MTEIQDLLSYKLHRVANLLSRGAELRYRREFGVSLLEWRTLALLGAAEEPMSLVQLARAAGVDKGQLSRVVTGLASRRLVRRDNMAIYYACFLGATGVMVLLTLLVRAVTPMAADQSYFVVVLTVLLMHYYFDHFLFSHPQLVE